MPWTLECPLCTAVWRLLNCVQGVFLQKMLIIEMQAVLVVSGVLYQWKQDFSNLYKMIHHDLPGFSWTRWSIHDLSKSLRIATTQSSAKVWNPQCMRVFCFLHETGKSTMAHLCFDDIIETPKWTSPNVPVIVFIVSPACGSKLKRTKAPYLGLKFGTTITTPKLVLSYLAVRIYLIVWS